MARADFFDTLFCYDAGVAIVNILWEPDMTCLLLEESTVAISACVRSIYSNKIDNITDRQPPLWPLARLWRSLDLHAQELDFGFTGSVHLQTQTHTPSLGHSEHAGWWVLSAHRALCKGGNCVEESSVAAQQ